MFKRTFLVVAILVFVGQLRGADPVMKAHFIDVGQGASTLLEFPCGAILIDTGGQDDDSSEHLKEYLREFFTRRPDLNNTLSSLIISHPHIDHTRGIKSVYEACRVARYIDDSLVQGSGKAGPKLVRDNRAASFPKNYARTSVSSSNQASKERRSASPESAATT
jgi:beta-lactamase superfamily II metal-dependent hydrolase